MLDYRKTFTAILNLKLLEAGSYLNLPNEEWSVKIMLNLLVNMGILNNSDEKKRDQLIYAQNVYMGHL